MQVNEMMTLYSFRTSKIKLSWFLENWRSSPEYVQFCKDGTRKSITSPIHETDAGKWLLEISFQTLQNPLCTGNQVVRSLVFSLTKKTTEGIPNLINIKGFLEITAAHPDGSTGHESEPWRLKRQFDQLLENEMFLADHENIKLLPPCCTSLKMTAEFEVDGWAPTIHTVPEASVKANEWSMGVDFCSLLEDKDFTDISIVVDGQTFSAHKAVLAARSPVLGAMLRSNMREKETKSIQLDDISSTGWEIFQRFLYSGAFDSDMECELELFLELLMMSDKYCVSSLLPHLEEGIIRKLSRDNVVEIYKMVNLFEVAKVKETAVDILVKCWSELDDERKKEIVVSVPALAAVLLGKLKV